MATTRNRRTITRTTSFTDDEDAITPCSSPPPEPQQPVSYNNNNNNNNNEPKQTCTSQFTASRPTSASVTFPSPKTSMGEPWHFDPTDGQDLSDTQLWRRMLDIQREFHCYNSARMSAALLGLELGVDVGRLAPSRSCLDLINESMYDMPETEKQRLTEWLHTNSSKRKRTSVWRRSTSSIL